MRVDNIHRRSIALAADGWSVEIIDQTLLPHRFEIRRLASPEDAAEAIRVMRVRGAPLIGATAAYGLALAMRGDPGDHNLQRHAHSLAVPRATCSSDGAWMRPWLAAIPRASMRSFSARA